MIRAPLSRASQAEIHIIKGHRKRLVQAAQRIPHVGTDQQAGPGHSGQILHRACTEHSPAAPALILMAVACIAPSPVMTPAC